jgi:hypothetical protein
LERKRLRTNPEGLTKPGDLINPEGLTHHEELTDPEDLTKPEGLTHPEDLFSRRNFILTKTFMTQIENVCDVKKRKR